VQIAWFLEFDAWLLQCLTEGRSLASTQARWRQDTILNSINDGVFTVDVKPQITSFLRSNVSLPENRISPFENSHTGYRWPQPEIMTHSVAKCNSTPCDRVPDDLPPQLYLPN
jgi:hypothetical protein